jgi:hypothetical protein
MSDLELLYAPRSAPDDKLAHHRLLAGGTDRVASVRRAAGRGLIRLGRALLADTRPTRTPIALDN